MHEAIESAFEQWLLYHRKGANAMLSNEFKRCPFCGGIAEAVIVDKYYKKVAIKCTMCEAQGKGFCGDADDVTALRGSDALEKAISAWNTRRGENDNI